MDEFNRIDIIHIKPEPDEYQLEIEDGISKDVSRDILQK